LASGFDWQTLVSEIATADRAPETVLQTQQTNLQAQNTAYGSIISELQTFQTDVQALQQTSLYTGRTTSVADPTVLSATAATGATAGSYAFNITQMAAASVQNGGTGISGALSTGTDVSTLALASANFSQPVTAGTFTVNGNQITVATTDTLQQVFDKISAATGGAVTGSYDNTTDTITLSSGSPITVGSAADTSNFLQVAQLYNNGTSSITSANALGSIQLNSTLANANFSNGITGDTSGNGSFTINGVTINYNLNTDTVNDVMKRINASGAGVVASYDNINNRFILANATTGDLGISLSDVTGNFLAATKLSTGTLTRGANLHYTLNGGGQIVSYSNTIDATSSGVTGLSVTALKTGSTTVTVGSDTGDLNTAITNFIAEYNKVQTLIDTQTSTSTDSTGAVTTSPLTGDTDISNLASRLRNEVFNSVPGLSGTINQLAQLGYSTNGQDNTIALTDSSALSNALSTNLSGVQDLFTNTTNGLAVQLNTYIGTLIGDSTGDTGSLVNHQNTLTSESTDLTNQINTIEQGVQAESARLTNEFVAMENTQAQINQQQQYLTQAITNGTI
jgi:flagellar hook-associated protein 2